MAKFARDDGADGGSRQPHGGAVQRHHEIERLHAAADQHMRNDQRAQPRLRHARHQVARRRLVAAAPARDQMPGGEQHDQRQRRQRGEGAEKVPRWLMWSMPKPAISGPTAMPAELPRKSRQIARAVLDRADHRWVSDIDAVMKVMPCTTAVMHSDHTLGQMNGSSRLTSDSATDRMIGRAAPKRSTSRPAGMPRKMGRHRVQPHPPCW